VVEVHHRDGVEWIELIDLVYQYLLCHPDKLEVLCKDCHKLTHEEDWLR